MLTPRSISPTAKASVPKTNLLRAQRPDLSGSVPSTVSSMFFQILSHSCSLAYLENQTLTEVWKVAWQSTAAPPQVKAMEIFLDKDLFAHNTCLNSGLDWLLTCRYARSCEGKSLSPAYSASSGMSLKVCESFVEHFGKFFFPISDRRLAWLSILLQISAFMDLTWYDIVISLLHHTFPRSQQNWNARIGKMRRTPLR